MNEVESMGRAFELARQAGVDQEVLYIWDPTDTVNALRRQFLGRLRTLSPIELPVWNLYSQAFEIKERL